MNRKPGLFAVPTEAFRPVFYRCRHCSFRWQGHKLPKSCPVCGTREWNQPKAGPPPPRAPATDLGFPRYKLPSGDVAIAYRIHGTGKHKSVFFEFASEPKESRRLYRYSLRQFNNLIRRAGYKPLDERLESLRIVRGVKATPKPEGESNA